ncbi:MAG: Fic family protein [archaeon]
MVNQILVDRIIVNEIGNKLIALRERKGSIFYSLLRSNSRDALEREAILHSYKIENPGEPIDEATKFKCHPSRRAIKKGVKSLSDAFNWGVKNFDPKKFNKTYVEEIAKRINPKGYPDGGRGYRTERAMVKGVNEERVMPSDISWEMDLYCENISEMLEKGTLIMALEAAAYAHLHLARIHPFEDGNGRTTRALQNIILDRNNLPPVIIFGGERYEYYAHLQGAIDDWNAYGKHDKSQRPNTPTRENDFYNFMAGRVSSSLDRIIGK